LGPSIFRGEFGFSDEKLQNFQQFDFHWDDNLALIEGIYEEQIPIITEKKPFPKFGAYWPNFGKYKIRLRRCFIRKCGSQ